MAEEEKTEAGAEAPAAKEEAPETKAPAAKEAPAAEKETPAAKEEAPEAKAPAAEKETPAAEEETPEAEAAAEPGAAPAEDLPAFTTREIDKMNVPKLKEAALSYTGKITGVHGMDKAQIVRALKEINGLPLQEAKRASKIDRQAIKQKIRAYKSERDAAIKDKDKGKLKRLRNRTKALRRKLVRNA